MPRVLMLLSNPFRPDPRVYKEATSLSGAGYDVSIIAWDREGTFEPEATIDDIRILRKGPRSGYGDPLTHTPNLLRFWCNMFREAMKRDFDVVHAHDLDTLPPGVLISWLRRKPLVYDAHESYSRMIFGNRPVKRLIKAIDREERFFARKARRIITVNDKLARMFKKTRRPVAVVMNCPVYRDATGEMPAELRKRWGLDGKFIILYVGVLERRRFLDEAIQAMAGIGDERVHLVIGGFGNLADHIADKAAKMSNVTFLGRVPAEEVVDHTRAADAVLCLFDPRDLNNRLGTPNKLFEAMVAGKPVIVTRGILSGEMAEREGMGLAIPYDRGAFMTAAKRMAGDPEMCARMGRNGQRAAKTKYNWERMTARLLKAYSKL